MKLIYPGSFDPITRGHEDMIERASKVFDHVIIALGQSDDKKKQLFSLDERIELIKKSCTKIRNVHVHSYQALTVDFAKKMGASFILRGLRSESDYSYEVQRALMNQSIDKNIETIFMASSPQYSFISSTLVKEIASYGGELTSLVSKHVVDALKKKF